MTATLATNSDWLAEDVRIVPRTAKNVAEYLGSSAVGGLFANGTITTSDRGGHVQVATSIAGGLGSVEVQGGTANAVTAEVIGAAKTLTVGSTTYSITMVRRSEALGLHAGMWVEIVNANTISKPIFTAAHNLDSVTSATGKFVLTAGTVWTSAIAAQSGLSWIVEKQGKFVAFIGSEVGGTPALTGLKEGDWVIITNTSLTLSLVNTGTFRVIRATTTTFWIENVNAIEEMATANMSFFQDGSMLVGDKLSINTDFWGTENQGDWIVSGAAGTSGLSNVEWNVATTSKVPEAVTTPGPGVLGSLSNLIVVREGTASKLIKRIRSISPNQTDGAYVDIKFESGEGYRGISADAGSVIRPLDKLAFPLGLVQGQDSYRYDVGLIGEANRVVYGDPGDPTTYPGVAAVGARLDIQGPLVKRITVALAIRVRGGNSANIINRVKSTVAGVINRSAVGQPIAISEIIKAASSVSGVVSVTVLSPTYTSGSDLISVQPYEKPLVLSLDQDIFVSLTGE